MTDQDFTAWLKKPHVLRVVLVEVVANVNGVDTIRYLSTYAYNTGPNDTPANQHYQPVVSTGMSFTEQLSLTSQASLSSGDIEINNIGGERDNWLHDIWCNRPVRAYVGDARWPRSDFQMIFNGVVADIAPKDRDTLALKIRDKLQLLNTPLSEAILGGTTAQKNALIPLTFGEVHNVTPLLSNPATLEYQVHDGAIEGAIEVRDNGLPVTANVNAATGKLTLNASPAGAITVSVQGDKVGGQYRNTVAQLIQRIVTGYGNASNRLTTADIDLDNFAAFDKAHPQPVGMYCNSRINDLNACQQLAGSVGAQIVMSRLGQLQLYQIDLASKGQQSEIRPKHMVERSLRPTNRTDVVAAVKLGFACNYTVQAGLQTALPAEHKDLYAIDWLTSTASDANVKAAYRLDVTPAQQNTMLLRRVDADAEAARQLALWKVPRTVYELEGTPELLSLKIGNSIKLYNDRFGMQNGVDGVVILLAPNWLNSHVRVGVLV